MKTLLFGEDTAVGRRETIVGPLADTVIGYMQRISELESICASQKQMLNEIAEAAGFTLGQAYTAAGIIASLSTNANLLRSPHSPTQAYEQHKDFLDE